VNKANIDGIILHKYFYRTLSGLRMHEGLYHIFSFYPSSLCLWMDRDASLVSSQAFLI